jgi:hypothetical protein
MSPGELFQQYTDALDRGDIQAMAALVHDEFPLEGAGMAPIPATGRSIHLPPEPAWVQVRDDKLLVYHVDAVPGGGINGILQQLGASSN